MHHDCNVIGDSDGDGIAGKVGNDNNHNDFVDYNDGRKSGGGGGRGTRRARWCCGGGRVCTLFRER